MKMNKTKINYRSTAFIIVNNSLEIFMAQVPPSPWSRWDAPG